MSLLLFDTTFLIDADRTSDHLDEMIDDDDDVAIAAVTVAELRVGVELSTGKARRAREAFVDVVIAAIPIVDYDLEIAEAHAQLLVVVRKQGRPRGAHDLMIAATALSTHRSVVTADARAFEQLPGLTVLTHR